MYRCECGKVSQPREKLNKRVIAVRQKKYVEKTFHKSVHGLIEHEDVIGVGSEIVKEVGLCKECAGLVSDVLAA